MTIPSVLEKLKSAPVKNESILLAVICMADLFSTVVLVRLGIASEANPILGWYLAQGVGMFVAAKTFLSIAPIAGLEIVGWRYPRLARLALRAGIVGYIAIYGIGSLQIHGMLS
jgi:hypothetical protein